MKAYLVSAESGEDSKYKLINSNGEVVKTFQESDEPVNADEEVEKYLKSLEPSPEERLKALEDAMLAILG
jgi:hypothetical protein